MTTLNAALPLSTELRLQVYKHLILASLASGTPHDLSATLFSSRTTYTELNAEIAKFRPLLVTARRWLDVEPEGKPLHIELSPECNLVAGPMEGEISIPTSWPSQVAAQRNFDLTFQYRDILLPVFDLPWSTLRLSVRTSETQSAFDTLFETGVVFRGLFVKREDGNNGPLCQDIDRLMLKFQIGMEIGHPPVERYIVAISVHEVRQYFRTIKDHNRFWVQEFKLEPNGMRWKLGLDFAEGLKEVGKVQKDNTFWRGGV